jgi:hypothetical protein
VEDAQEIAALAALAQPGLGRQNTSGSLMARRM